MLLRPEAWRFARRFARSGAAPREQEVLLDIDGEPRPASLYLPAHEPSDGPGWVMLHGVTVPGRHHVAARRLARALAAAGHTSILPEIPAWTGLKVRPDEAEPAISAGIAYLRNRLRVAPDRIGLMGFSVAATWSLEAAAGPLRDTVRAVLAAGGYADFARTLQAMVTGHHEWRGRHEFLRPDPYGRWIVGASLLPVLDDDAWGDAAARGEAADALRSLAWTAGRNGIRADQPVYDSLIADLRASLAPSVQAAWDLLAPPSAHLAPDPADAEALVQHLAGAGLRSMPRLSPEGRLDGLRPQTRVLLLHGRTDRLIPYSETLRLRTMLPPAVHPRVTITRLIGHTKGSEAAPLRNPLAVANEVRSFLRFADDLVGALDA